MYENKTVCLQMPTQSNYLSIYFLTSSTSHTVIGSIISSGLNCQACHFSTKCINVGRWPYALPVPSPRIKQSQRRDQNHRNFTIIVSLCVCVCTCVFVCDCLCACQHPIIQQTLLSTTTSQSTFCHSFGVQFGSSASDNSILHFKHPMHTSTHKHT